MLGEIQTVTNNPFIADSETEIVNIDIDFCLVLFVQQDAGPDRCRSTGLQHVNQVMDGLARIDDILDDDDVAALNAFPNVHDQADCATRGAAMLVIGNCDELDRSRDAQPARYVRKENESAF